MSEAPSTPLPPEIRMSLEESTGVRIRTHLVRAALEMNHDQAEAPLPLVKLLTLLADLANHASELETFLGTVWPAWQRFSQRSAIHEPTSEAVSLFEEMRAALLSDEPNRLSLVLGRQRRAAHLCLAIQSAIKMASAEFSQEIAAEFNPASIVAAVGARQRPEQYLKHFETVADRFTASEVERRFTQRFVGAVEALYAQSHSPVS